MADYTYTFLAVPARHPWADKAACRGAPTDLFYPRAGESIAEAKAICESCSVRQECRAWAVPHEKFGYWGGLTERARRDLRRGAARLVECVVCRRAFTTSRLNGVPPQCSAACRKVVRDQTRRESRLRAS